MSGGIFNYGQSDLASELFGRGTDVDIDYGERGHNNSKNARKLNPMEDREVSEIVFDVLCLIHSLDWYKSGDTCESDYMDDVQWFKKKWFNRTDSDRVEDYKNDLREYCNELLDEFKLP